MAAAREMLMRHPNLKFAVLEKENRLGNLYILLFQFMPLMNGKFDSFQDVNIRWIMILNL